MNIKKYLSWDTKVVMECASYVKWIMLSWE